MQRQETSQKFKASLVYLSQLVLHSKNSSCVGHVDWLRASCELHLVGQLLVNTQPLDPLDFLARLPWRKSLPISCLWSWPLECLFLVTGTRFLWPQMPSILPEPLLSLMLGLGRATGLPHMVSWRDGLWLTVSLLFKQTEG